MKQNSLRSITQNTFLPANYLCTQTIAHRPLFGDQPPSNPPSNVITRRSPQNCGNIETSAKRDLNINEAFVKLFEIARLPSEMSPSLHRRVTAVAERETSSSSSDAAAAKSTPGSAAAAAAVSGGLLSPAMSLRRRVSEACGAVAANARRPSVRTDLLMMSYKRHDSQNGNDGQSHSKIVTACCCQ